MLLQRSGNRTDNTGISLGGYNKQLGHGKNLGINKEVWRCTSTCMQWCMQANIVSRWSSRVESFYSCSCTNDSIQVLYNYPLPGHIQLNSLSWWHSNSNPEIYTIPYKFCI